ncbi:MAG: NADH:ubiquinone oxidoreductase [Ferroplasma sp.]
MNWFLSGLKNRVRTEKLGKYVLESPSVLEGESDCKCPVDALKDGKWNGNKCIFCMRCDLKATGRQELFAVNDKIPPILSRSLYLYPIDSGTCGACNIEFTSLFAPQYDINRFKIFMANTPRHADALVVMGVYTENMEKVIENAYNAMPEPKIIIGIGSCALSGGIIGTAVAKKYSIEIAGCPPSPENIINAINRAREKND